MFEKLVCKIRGKHFIVYGSTVCARCGTDWMKELTNLTKEALELHIRTCPSPNVVPIEEVLAIRERRKQINSYGLDQIIWTRKGKVVSPTPEQIDEWRFTGLSNVDFIENDSQNPFPSFIEGIHGASDHNFS